MSYWTDFFHPFKISREGLLSSNTATLMVHLPLTCSFCAFSLSPWAASLDHPHRWQSSDMSRFVFSTHCHHHPPHSLQNFKVQSHFEREKPSQSDILASSSHQLARPPPPPHQLPSVSLYPPSPSRKRGPLSTPTFCMGCGLVPSSPIS